MENISTNYFTDNDKEIFVNDRISSIYGYDVIVQLDEYGNVYGQLVCDDNHSCKDIPYAINKGKGYFKN